MKKPKDATLKARPRTTAVEKAADARHSSARVSSDRWWRKPVITVAPLLVVVVLATLFVTITHPKSLDISSVTTHLRAEFFPPSQPSPVASSSQNRANRETGSYVTHGANSPIINGTINGSVNIGNDPMKTPNK